MATLSHNISVFSDGSLQWQVAPAPRFRIVWDDENPDYNYKCRTQSGSWTGPDNPPAVVPYFGVMNEADRQKVNLEKDPSWEWYETITILNGGDERKTIYLSGSGRAQFNESGWPRMAYLAMSGNYLQGYRMGDWFRFETLKPTDWLRARSMSIVTHPWLIHNFTCVTWDAATRTTKHIESTGTERGQVYYPLISWNGYAYIPWRHVKQE